ncbi:MAG: S8 family peptidase, partial [Melioribacteraceae bacterium]|nr:S8 family peptidase [Melioribacteraceae bacterium]
MNIKTKLSILLFAASSILAQSNIIEDGGNYYFADRLVIKYKNNSDGLMKINDNISSKFGIIESRRTFTQIDENSANSREINKIYTIKFSSPFNPLYIAKELANTENIEWVEPCYLYRTTYTPNDPIFNEANENNFVMLDLIRAQDAWDINRGSEDVVIAIIDTGVDWNHPDLEDNIWINLQEIPDNGIDDDGNGFTDDIRGWDFGGLDGTADNDPNEDRADHGTHVAGLASAVTDNNIGIASIGFNSKIMAVKTSQDDIRSTDNNALIAYGYEGIVYAADNGANIINCSWGGYSYSQAAQDAIDYAVAKGALVVASAGNGNRTDKFYPASYEGVLSVAGTNFVDQRAGWSNYGTKVDVTSPGVSIYSTWFNDSYAIKQGTSMSAPIVAGLAGLVFDQFPDFTPLQVGEQIRVNTDNIDGVNSSYTKMLGSGRINALKALSNTNSKSVRISSKQIVEIGDGDDIFESGETIRISIELTNYLEPTSNLSVQLTTDDDNLSVINSGGTFGALNTLETVGTNPDFFELKINNNAPENLEVNLLVSYSDNNYNDFEWISILINPTYHIQTTD